MDGRRGKTLLAVGVLATLVALFPLLLSNDYALGIGISAGAMAVGTVGFVLLIGYAHQLALGQAVFCAIGGYASAVLCTRHAWDPMLALIAGAVLSMILAYVVGRPILRLRGYVLAMASLALQLALLHLAQESELTGAALGISGIPRFAVLGLPMQSDLAFYYLVWGMVAVSIGIGISIDRSRIGRALKAMGASENAAVASAIDVAKYKSQMFVVSAGLASVSGSLMVHYLRVMEPSIFGFGYSLNIITAVIVGGLSSIWGGAIGAALIIGVREMLRAFSLPAWEAVIMGALTILVLIAFPKGFAGFLSGLHDRIFAVRKTVSFARLDSDESMVAVPMTSGPLLEVVGACRTFGSLRAVADVSFQVPAGTITCLIGPNGAGKTTLFNLISGFDVLDSGRVLVDGRAVEAMRPEQIATLGVARTFQSIQLFDNLTVLENVMCGAHRHESAGLLAICGRLPQVARDERESRKLAAMCLDFVGLGEWSGRMPNELSFGHQRLVELARALALKPRLLLMDEPASGLNDSETERLAEILIRIQSLGVTILMVEHDMRLVMGLSDRLVVLHHGEKIAEGPPAEVRRMPDVVTAYLGH